MMPGRGCRRATTAHGDVVFQAKESKQLSGSDAEIDELMRELITNHTIG